MALYAMGDLHLAASVNKPMDIFGTEWENHVERIEENWRSQILNDDIVLIPGDISWAMTLEEAKPDLDWIGTLPGLKVLTRGNHDYWWSSISKVRNTLPNNMYAIQNDYLEFETHTIAGTRGWLLPSHPNFSQDDERILLREVNRLRLSLQAAAAKDKDIICMLHYPPLGPDGEDTLFTDLLAQYSVQTCIYGHLHGHAHRFAVNRVHQGVRYQLVSGDYLAFKPLMLS